jgi:uncharacterized protein (TIGR00369 family)
MAAPEAGYEERVRASFTRQGLMTTLGASLVEVAPGAVAIALPFDARLTQQHGFLHTGALIAVLDSACGYAALTLLPTGSEVLTVELKVNLLAPATGERFEARGEVIRSGRTLSVCRGEAYALGPEGRTHVATLLTTMIARAAR